VKREADREPWGGPPPGVSRLTLNASPLRLWEGALKHGNRVLALVLLSGASASSGGQQTPISGCGAAVSCSGPRGFSTLTRETNPNTFGISSRGWRPRWDIRLELPPPPDARDRGAIEASAAIVLGRNRKLRENLAVAKAAAIPPQPAAQPFAGEVLIRVTGRPEPPAGAWRRDLPQDAFAAMPLRRPVTPQFDPRPR
jgi:hypothetical protein